MIFIQNLLLIGVALSILIFIYALYYLYSSLKPARFITPIKPSHYGLTWENVEFKTSDGILIKGWFVSSQSDKATIVCHGYPFDKGNVLPLAKFLYPDYNLLLFDFRAMGESEGTLSTAGYKEVLDIQAALNYLQAKGFQKIGILGLSMGASVALMSCKDERIKAIVADSPYASINKLLDELLKNLFLFKGAFKRILKKLGKWFLKIDFADVSPRRAIKDSLTPTMIIHGDQDEQVHLSHALSLKETNPQIQLWIVPGSHHGEGHELYPEEYENRVKEFLKQNL